MRYNFDGLMTELKETNEGQEKIMQELKKMKSSWHEHDKKQNEIEKEEKK